MKIYCINMEIIKFDCAFMFTCLILSSHKSSACLPCNRQNHVKQLPTKTDISSREMNLGTDNPSFRIIMNAPTEKCMSEYGIHIDLEHYDIERNSNRGLLGNVISLFYSNFLGLYPYVSSNGTLINGGIPQLVNLTAHLEQTLRDVARLIPNVTFDGVGVVDWEYWRPVWQRNYDRFQVYQHLSQRLVKQSHPAWTPVQVQTEAKKQFEYAARFLMERTLTLLKAARPGGLWGYYGFPRCYNYQGTTSCPGNTTKYNDELFWLFNASSALFPSAYLSPNTPQHNANFVFGQLNETLRVRRNLGYRPIYLYSRIRYTGEFGSYYSQADLNNTIGQSKTMGIDGVIIWDDNYMVQSETSCSKLLYYLRYTLGPYVQSLRAN